MLDDQYSGASHIGQIVVVTGTPAGSPSAPATPKNSLVLAHIAVGASVTSIVTANITDFRPQFVSGVPGQLIASQQYDPTTQASYTRWCGQLSTALTSLLNFVAPPSGMTYFALKRSSAWFAVTGVLSSQTGRQYHRRFDRCRQLSRQRCITPSSPRTAFARVQDLTQDALSTASLQSPNIAVQTCSPVLAGGVTLGCTTASSFFIGGNGGTMAT